MDSFLDDSVVTNLACLAPSIHLANLAVRRAKLLFYLADYLNVRKAKMVVFVVAFFPKGLLF